MSREGRQAGDREKTITESMESFLDRFHLAIVILCVLSAVVLSWGIIQFSVDDSFISYRYAKNLVEHGVWNWNPYGDRVEAYTNFSYATLAVIPALLGLNTPLFFKGLGILLFVALLLRARHYAVNRAAFLCVLIATCLNPVFFVHLYSGLETPLFLFLVFESFGLLASDEARKRETYLYALLLLLPLTRPEGAVFAAVALGCHAVRCRGKIGALWFLGLCGVFTAGYVFWRFQYFGQFLPNSFYVKSMHVFTMRRLLKNVVDAAPFFLMAVILLLFCKYNAIRLSVVVGAVLFLFLYAPSRLAMNFASRFPFQVFFPAIILWAAFHRSRATPILLTSLFFLTISITLRVTSSRLL